ncbi:MAG: S41 family peptidase [Roseimicrobium sp.]
MKSHRVLLLLAACCLRASAQEAVAPKTATAPPDDPAFAQLELLTRVMETVRQNYVDENKVSYEQLIEGALEGMLKKLDPHCGYMGRSLFEEMQQEQRDTSEGVGITIALREGLLSIITVDENGPAAKAGVLPGDQLVRIGDALTENMSTMEAVQQLKGKAGEAIRITVRRPGTTQFFDFNLVRQALQESSVRDGMLLHEKIAAPWKIGYVRVTEFTQNTAKDLSEELEKLEKAGMQAFVLDLRNNPGGLVSSAVEVCGEFLPPNTVVVTTEGRVPSQNQPPYRTPARHGRPLRKYPITVLINQSSASAAELVAGALQDLKRGIVVGTKSFGKGSVQTIMPMKNGAAMRLTTAKYYTPSHRTIHQNGIEPDIVSALTTAEESKVMQWRASNVVGEARTLDLANVGDRQLERATDVLKGLLVYQQFSKPTPAPASSTAPTQAPAAPTDTAEPSVIRDLTSPGVR